MSFIFLHVGQCGNQLSHSFWEETLSPKWTINPSTKASDNSKFPSKRLSTPTHHNPYTLCDGSFPCVLVDAERKVVRQCLTSHKVFGSRIRDECVVTDRMGRGNIWAFGYHGHKKCTGGESMLGRTMEAVRKCLERCDRFSGFIMLHSVSGGTGSG